MKIVVGVVCCDDRLMEEGRQEVVVVVECVEEKVVFRWKKRGTL
jgi:hypothetical protein